MLDIYTFGDDMYPIVLKRFQDRLDKRSGLIKEVIGYQSLKTSNQYADEGMGGYGLIPKYDGTNITELNQKRGFKTIYTPEEYAGKATVQYKYAKIDQSGEAAKAGNKMADSIAMTQLRNFYNLFAQGWNAGITGADGKSLFATDHPTNADSDSTFSNTGTDTFSISAITKAQTAAQRFKTFDGLDFDCDFDLVLIPPELMPKAKEFFGEKAELLPESAENGQNPVQGMKWKVIKGLTSKQWIVGDSLLMKEYMKMVEITAPMVLQVKPDNPLITQYVAYADFAFGYSDARCVYGMNPA